MNKILTTQNLVNFILICALIFSFIALFFTINTFTTNQKAKEIITETDRLIQESQKFIDFNNQYLENILTDYERQY